MCDCTTQTGGWGGSRTMPKLLAFDIRIICCKQNNTACIIKQLHVPFLSPSTSAVLTTPPWISWNFRLLITMTAISSASPSTATSYKTSKSFLYSKPKTCTCILIQFTVEEEIFVWKNYGITDKSRQSEHVAILSLVHIYMKNEKWKNDDILLFLMYLL